MDVHINPAKREHITNYIPYPVITYIFDSSNVINRNDFKRRVLAAMPATQKIAANASESIYTHSKLSAGFTPDGYGVSSLNSITKLKQLTNIDLGSGEVSFDKWIGMTND